MWERSSLEMPYPVSLIATETFFASGLDNADGNGALFGKLHRIRNEIDEHLAKFYTIRIDLRPGRVIDQAGPLKLVGQFPKLKSPSP